MKLIVCPNCNQQVSNLAAKCPQCGKPITHDARVGLQTTGKSGGGLLGKFVWLIVLAALIGGLYYFFFMR